MEKAARFFLTQFQIYTSVVLRLKSILLCFCIVLFTQLLGQGFPQKGMPLVENYTPEQYFNKGKVWDIASAPNGIVYFAADKGLLEYDGKTWRCFKGSKGFTRSLFILNDSIIYTGSDLDFGIWKRNKFQEFEYSSLYPFHWDIKEINEEFWHVAIEKDKVLFISFNNIYIYKKGQLTKISAPSKFTDCFAAHDSVYFADENEGLFVLNNLRLKPVLNYSSQTSLEIKGIFNNNNDKILVTKNSGLFNYRNGILKPLNSQLSQKLADAKVFCFKQLNKNQLAFGTVLKGLFITDVDGNIIQHINKKKGLPNNTILSIHQSGNGKLWMGLDQGISSLDINSNISFFKDYMGDFGSGYTACLKDNIFYLGTNQGLYQSKWVDLNNNAEFYNFQLIAGTEGQVWSLKEINNTLLIGHDKGLFSLNRNNIQKISNEPGFWAITAYQNNYLLTGNYNGISIFKKSNNSWNFVKKMELILGSCNQVLYQKKNIIWVNIPNFGVIRAVLNDNIYPTARQIIPESEFDGKNLLLHQKGNEIFLISDSFEYQYSETEKRFIKNDKSNHLSNNHGSIEHVNLSLPINSNYTFFPIYNGFSLQYTGKKLIEANPNNEIVFRKLLAFNNDSSNNYAVNSRIPYQLNNIKFEWIVPNQSNVLYQFKTEKNKNWSEPSIKNTHEILNLKPGQYTILARAIVNGKTTAEKSISFELAAPWYRTKYVLILYFLILSALVFTLYRLQQIQLKKQKVNLLQKKEIALKEQADQHNREVLALEQEVFKNEFELLKQQLKNKTIELANKAKDNDEKKNLLLSIKEKFENLQAIDPVQSKLKLNEIKRLLDSHLNVEDHTFEIQIDELHQEFFKKLKDKFPSLSTQDLRLCAYLKIGMNSKEIAEILNIQPSSAFVSRSRLRKKLNLKVDEDINTFLNAI